MRSRGSFWTHFKLDRRTPAGRGSDGFGYRFVLPHRLEAAQQKVIFDKGISTLLVIDPYTDFISEGGKLMGSLEDCCRSK